MEDPSQSSREDVTYFNDVIDPFGVSALHDDVRDDVHDDVRDDVRDDVCFDDRRLKIRAIENEAWRACGNRYLHIPSWRKPLVQMRTKRKMM